MPCVKGKTMPGFLTASEIKLIDKDLATLVDSPEANFVCVSYTGLASETGGAYKVEIPGEHYQFEIKCIQKVITEPEVRDKKFMLLEIGDCLFYIHGAFDVGEPLKGKPAQKDSLVFTDYGGVSWRPSVEKSNDPKLRYTMQIGKTHYATIIAAETIKGDS